MLLLRKAELQAEQEAWTPFDVKRGPLLRARLLRLGANDHVLFLTLHHVVVDGSSIGIFFDEVSRLYSEFAAGRKPQLPQPALQFSDFAHWQRSWCTTTAAAEQLAYWKEHLREASAIFPADIDRDRTLLSSPVVHEPFHLPSELVGRLSALSRRQGVTLFMTFLAGFKALLLTQTGRNDICVATPMANRSQLNAERVIGPLVNTTLIRSQLRHDMPFQEALHCVRDSVLNSHERQEFPFDILAARLAEENVDPVSLIQVFFELRNAARPSLKLPDLVVRSFGDVYQEGQPRLPIDRTWLTMTLKQHTLSGIIGSCMYKQDRFGSETIRGWIADYKTILTNAAADPETPLTQLVIDDDRRTKCSGTS